MTNQFKPAALSAILETVDNDAVEAALIATEGSGGGGIAPEGMALALITGYVELGEHADKKGQIKPKSMIEMELFDIDDESEPVFTRKVKDDDGVEHSKGTSFSHRFNNISRNEKALFRQQLDTMFTAAQLPEGTVNPIELVGRVIMVEVVHNKVGEGEGAKTYANLDESKAIALPACETDRVGRPLFNKPLNIPEDVDLDNVKWRVFSWNAPSPEQWKTIEIEGTYTAKDKDGKEVEKSKNWIQEIIRKAVNFSNSPVESMLMTAGSSQMPVPTKAKSKNVVIKKKAKVVKEEVAEVEVPEAEVTQATGEAPKSVLNSDAVKLIEAGLKDAQEVKAFFESRGMPTDDQDAKIAKLQAELDALVK